MNNNIFFSIIIPTYNRAELIKTTISSILDQTFSDFEIIIVDDGSTDNTCEIVSSFKDSRIILKSKKNEERAVARNTGTKIAKGKYVTFIDSDDVFYLNHLSTAIEVIEKSGHPEIVHLRYEIKNRDNTNVNPVPLLDSKINYLLIEGNFMSCNGVFLRNDVAIENLFNEDRILSGLEDWELWLRIASKYKIYYDNRITSAIINHDDRSVLNIKKEDLIKSFDALFKYVFANKEVTTFYHGKLAAFTASCYTYIALHLALAKKYKADVIIFLFKGIYKNPKFIFSKRFFAILKHYL